MPKQTERERLVDLLEKALVKPKKRVKTKPSRAIVAMGRMDLTTGGVRVSGGWGTT